MTIMTGSLYRGLPWKKYTSKNSAVMTSTSIYTKTKVFILCEEYPFLVIAKSLYYFVIAKLSSSCHCEPASGRRGNHIHLYPHSFSFHSYTSSHIFILISILIFAFVFYISPSAVMGNPIHCSPYSFTNP